MDGLPVTIRLLDPPLHEFLPHADAEIAEVAAALGADAEEARRPRRASCTSSTRCSASAAAGSPSPIPRSPRCRRAPSSRPRSRPASAPASRCVPEIMVPLIATKAELDLVKARIDAMARGGRARRPAPSSTYQVGTMIELPRAALLAGEIAETRRVLLLRHQRPDADRRSASAATTRRASSAPTPRAASCRPIRSCRSTARASASWCASAPSAAARSRPNLKLGICGEHGGDPASVAFCHEVGLDYVSCSPFRVPIARLAAAQAALGKGGAQA